MGLSVLIVDDEPDILSSMGRILRLDGYQVETAATIAEALDREDWSGYFAILLDRKLPDGVSDDLIPKLKRLAPQAAVIVITAYADLESSLAGLRSGVEDYLLKPIEPDAVLHRLRRVRDMKRAEERAVQAERLAAIGGMMTAIAHESRNALQRGQANLEMLGFEVEDNEEAVEFIGKIENALDDLQRLFEEVRSYAAPINLEQADTTLPEVWREAWGLLSSNRSGREVTLREETNGDVLACRVDRFRLVQVFRNLLENSLAACSDPVEIEIHGSESRVGDQEMIRLRVRDNGPGLTSEQRQKIFDPFFTTKTKGTGLGMAIAQRIIEAHGGTIAVGDGDRPGAEFVIELPR